MATYFVNKAYTGSISGSLGEATNPFTTIAAALTAAAASGDTIQIASGTYTHTGTLLINKSVTIIGDGLGETIIERSGSASGTEDRTVEVSASNVTIQDLSFTGWENATTSANAGRGYLVWNTGDNNTYERVGFDSNNIRVAIYIGTSDGLTITDSAFTGDLYRYAIRGAGEHMEITDNVFQTSHYEAGPIYFEYGAPTSGVISGNLFEHSFGVDVLVPGGTTFKSDGTTAYTITNWQPNKITGDGLVISDNTFRFMNPDAVNENGYTPSVSAIYNDFLLKTSGPVTISNNTFEDYTFVPPPSVDLPGTDEDGSYNNSAALVLDGAEQYGTFTLGDEVGEQGTLSFWVQLDDTQLGRRHQILEGPGNGGLEFQYRNNGGGQYFVTVNGAAGTYQISDGAHGTGNWLNVQYTWDLSTNEVNIYFNGVEAASYALTQTTWTPLSTDGGTFYLGRDPGDASRMLDGKLDEMAIFNRALTPAELAEVREHFADLDANTDPSLVAAWNFEGVTGDVVGGAAGTNVEIKLHSIRDGSDAPATIVINGGPDGVDITANTFHNSTAPQTAGDVNVSLNSIGPTEGDDIFYAISSAGNEHIDGLGGTDTYDATGVDGIIVHLADGFSFGAETGYDTLENFENVRGSGGDDVLIGDDNQNTFYATAGHDIIDGRGDFWDENDVRHGDTIDARDGSGPLTIDFTNGTLIGGAFNIEFQNVETVLAGSGDDTIIVGHEWDWAVDGGAGVDTLKVDHTIDGVDVRWNGDEQAFEVGYGWENNTGDNNDIDVDEDDGHVRVKGVEAIELSDGTHILLVGGGGYATIQAAINAAHDNDTIVVAAGTYNESLLIGAIQNLTIRGANHGIAGDGERDDESTITGGIRIESAASHVTISGFEITGNYPAKTSSILVLGEDTVITDNRLIAEHDVATGIDVGGGAGSVQITDNLVEGYSAYGAYVNADGVNPATVTNNTFTDNPRGVAFEDSTPVGDVSGNTFSSTARDVQVWLRDPGDADLNGLIGTNHFTGGSIPPLYVFVDGDVEVTGTSLDEVYTVYDHPELGVTVDAGGGNDTILGGTGNDTIDGGDGNDQIDGGGGVDTATDYDGSYHLDFVNDQWIVTDGTTTDTLSGVERVNIDGQVYLLVDKSGTGGFSTVQDAVDQVEASGNGGEIILVAPGDYPEDIDIDNFGLDFSIHSLNAGKGPDDWDIDKVATINRIGAGGASLEIDGLAIKATTINDVGGPYWTAITFGGHSDDALTVRNSTLTVDATSNGPAITDQAIAFNISAGTGDITIENVEVTHFTNVNTGPSGATNKGAWINSYEPTDETRAVTITNSVFDVGDDNHSYSLAFDGYPGVLNVTGNTFGSSPILQGDPGAAVRIFDYQEVRGASDWSGISGNTFTQPAGHNGLMVDDSEFSNSATGETSTFGSATYGDGTSFESVIDASNASSGQTLVGTSGDDLVTGSAFGDTITGGDGSDSIDAGSGIDTVVFEHALNEYTIQRTGGTYAVTRNGTVDTVTGAENFKFGTQTFNVQGASADAIINQFAPVFAPLGAESVSIAENIANVIVYDANATDADSAAIFGNIVYSLEGADAGAFSINSASGQVTLTAAADRETQASYALTIRASQGVTTSTKALTVNVTDVNDNPVVFTSGATASVQENSSTGTVVYNADATDKDTGTMVYSLAGTDAGAFNIDAATGEVRLKAAADFETKASYAFSVVATQGGSSASQAVTLTVTNVDEGIVSGVDAKTVQVEAGSTKAALGTLSSNAALTFDVVAVNNGGGHVYLGDTELAVGVTGLTQAQINSLTFSSVNDGSIQFLAHDGGNTDELNVILDVTAGVGKTYTGDSGANTIDGADGNDTILGKAGADHLLGGAGKDTIDGGAGADWIDGGAGKDSITGGKGNDTIFGGAGKDHLDGGKGDDELHGGLGKDTLTGGSGADKFVFDTALAANNADVIEDFVHGKDTIVLDSDIFAALGAKVGSKEFRANLSGDAQDKNDKLIYETDTGKLYYDADGNKSGDKVLVATFDPHVSNLSHLDFEIV